MSPNFKFICLKFNTVLLFMLLCLTAAAQRNFKPIDDFLLANQKELGNDAVVMIAKDSNIVYSKAVGDFNIKTRAPIASCSKWLTAALVMTFVDEGKLSLDETISTHLPIFATYGKNYITIRNCLSHTTGITDNSRMLMKILERKKFETLDEEVSTFAKREIAANPGTSFFYGNIGLNIAARVLEVISKKSFESLVKQRLFAPLEMRNSSFAPADNAVNPSGGAESTAADYMNFLTMLMNKGIYKGKRVLSEKAVEEMQKIQTVKATKKFVPTVATGFEYGLGEWIQEQDASGNSTVVSSPGLFGTWPYIDKQKNYACIIFVKKLLSTDRKELYVDLKKRVDEVMK